MTGCYRSAAPFDACKSGYRALTGPINELGNGSESSGPGASQYQRWASAVIDQLEIYDGSPSGAELTEVSVLCSMILKSQLGLHAVTETAALERVMTTGESSFNSEVA